MQVSRLGNPLINEVVIPIGQKDKFNRTSPADDAGELRQVRAQPRAGAAAERPVQPRRQGDEPDGHRPGAADRRPGPHADRLQPGAGGHAEGQPRRAARRDGEPVRRARGRHGRLPERPPARRRRHRHRAARHRRRAAAGRRGRQADPARRRRRPERQAVPVGVPVRGPAHRRPQRHRRSGRSPRTPRSRSRPSRRSHADASPPPVRRRPVVRRSRSPCSRRRGATSGRRRARPSPAPPSLRPAVEHRRGAAPPAGRRPPRRRRARPSSPPPTSRRRARPATPASTPAPTACCAARWRAARPTPPSWSRPARSPPAGTTSAAPSASRAAPARWRPTSLASYPGARRRARRARPLPRRRADAAADGRPQAQPRRVRARVVRARAARRPRRRGRRDAPRRRRRRPGRPRTSPTCRRCSATSSSTRGRTAAARRAYAAALAAVPGYVPGRGGPRAARGRARATCAARSRAGGGSSRGSRCPSTRSRSARPSWPPAGARPAGATSRSCAPSRRCWRQAGVNTDVELAIFEADHGDRDRAVELARRGVGAGAERALRGRARVGADARGPPARRAALGAARAAARLARPDVPLPRRHAPPRRPRPGATDARRSEAAGTCASRSRTASTRTPATPTAPARRWRNDEAHARRGRPGRRRRRGRRRPRPRAHPLGNFSVNHLSQVSVSADRVDVRYVLDEAEIPTFQQRGADRRRAARPQARGGRAPAGAHRRRPARGAAPGGRAAASRIRTGQGGLPHDADRAAAVRAGRRRRAASSCATARSPGRVGWKAIVPAARRGTAVRSSAPAADPTDGLRRYPEDLLSSPADMRTATFAVRPGAGTLQAPDGTRLGEPADRDADDGHHEGVQRRGGRPRRAAPAAADRVRVGRAARALARPRQGDGGRLPRRHARDGAPRGRARRDRHRDPHRRRVRARRGRAAAVGVRPARGPVPVAEPRVGRLVLVVGVGVLRSRVRWAARARTAIDHGHSHDHHAHDHDHAHGHTHSHGGGKPHSHALPERLSWRGLAAMGAAAGLIPCPSALVVLLGAVAQGQIALGMLLIVAFSAGLAATLTALGLAVVYAGRALSRVAGARPRRARAADGLRGADRRRRRRPHGAGRPADHRMNSLSADLMQERVIRMCISCARGVRSREREPRAERRGPTVTVSHHTPPLVAPTSRPPSSCCAPAASASPPPAGSCSRRCSPPTARCRPRRSPPGSRAGCPPPTSRRCTATSTCSRRSASCATSTSATAPACYSLASAGELRVRAAASSAARSRPSQPGELDGVRALIARDARLRRPLHPLPDRRTLRRVRCAPAAPTPERSTSRMHIPDGFLSNEVAAGVARVAGGRRGRLRPAARRASTLDERRVPLLGVTAAFVFAAQMLNFPVAGGTSGHFLGAALAAVLLGPVARLPGAGGGARRPGVRLRRRRRHGARRQHPQHGRGRRAGASAG